jgi:ribosomal protein S17E
MTNPKLTQKLVDTLVKQGYKEIMKTYYKYLDGEDYLENLDNLKKIFGMFPTNIKEPEFPE